MIIDTILDKTPYWISDDSPSAGEAVLSHCTLSRNLADFPFPGRCGEEEKGRIEERVLGYLESLNLLSSGRYYHLQDMEPREARFLAERRLITYELMKGQGTRGVYVSDDQCLSIMVNGLDHLCLRFMLSGLQVNEAWTRLTSIDDTLGGLMDFAYHERLGYLTASLANVGTGLKAGVLLHLPCLALSGRLSEQVAHAARHQLNLEGIRAGFADEVTPRAKRERQALANQRRRFSHENDVQDQSIYSDISGAIASPSKDMLGDLYMLSNQGTLGVSEAEIVFNVRHMAGNIIAEEKNARQGLIQDGLRALEDQVGRAQGIAGGAHLLGFEEGISLLSSLRLGVVAGLLPNYSLQTMNEVLLSNQGAHLESARGQSCDPLTLNMERADLFRSRFP